MLPLVHARNDRSEWIAECLASSALRLAPAPEPPGDKPPPGLDVEHAADVARVDSPILAHISEDRRGETIVDATAARPEGPVHRRFEMARARLVGMLEASREP